MFENKIIRKMGRQQELDIFRQKLGLDKITINKQTKSPFTQSLKEYARIHNVPFCVEMTYGDDNLVTVSMTFKNNVYFKIGKVGQQDIYMRDELDDLQDKISKTILK